MSLDPALREAGLAHPHVWARVLDRPHLCTPAVLQSVLRVLAGRSGVELTLAGVPQPLADAPDPALFFDDDGPEEPVEDPRPYDLRDGMAIIPVRGTLVGRNGLHPYCGMTGYDGLRRKIAAAVDDAAVRAIVLDIDSGGGEAAGCFEVADQLWAARQAKPLWAACTPEAYSAAYALASQAERVFVPVVGGTGSVGVVSVHLDHSARLSKEGLAVTLITAGARKADGNPYQPLPEAVRDRWQSIVDEIRTEFVTRVSRGRGLSAEAVLATEADCLTPAESLRLGFATDRGDLDSCLGALADHLSKPAKESSPMAARQTTRSARRSGARPTAATKRPRSRAEVPEEDEDPDDPQAEGDTPEDDEDDAPAAEGDAPEDDEDEDPAAEGDSPADEEDEDKPAARRGAKARKARANAKAGNPRVAERKRWASVMAAPEAQGREATARELLSTSDMTPEQILTVLKTVPQAQASGSGFRAAMTQRSPQLGSGATASTPQTPGAALMDRMRARYKTGA